MANSPVSTKSASASGSSGSESVLRPRAYCSESNPAETLAGTADQVDVWLCLEYRPAWKPKALIDNALSAPTRFWISETLAALQAIGLKARPQFIRQPGTDTEDTRLLVSSGGRSFEFSGRGYDFLRELDLADWIQAPEKLAVNGRELEALQYLVCTNGQRDLCCARFGLPTYTALREQVGDRVWQVTHLGGHRFAPNVLTLPDGCLYGRVHADGATDFLATVEAGQVDFGRLRGRTCYSPVVQAAEALLARPGMRLLHVTGEDSRATVQFADSTERRSITLERSTTAIEVTKSCGDEAPAGIFPFEEISRD